MQALDRVIERAGANFDHPVGAVVAHHLMHLVGMHRPGVQQAQHRQRQRCQRPMWFSPHRLLHVEYVYGAKS
jgi:hypothetical protein